MQSCSVQPARFVLFAAILAAGCSGGFGTTGAAEPLVRVHAERDLDCPNDQIRVSEEWGGHYKAIGCGRKAMYRTACDALNCVVRPDDEPAIPWKDRPQPTDPAINR